MSSLTKNQLKQKILPLTGMKKLPPIPNSSISQNEEQTLKSMVKQLQLEIQTLKNNPNQKKKKLLKNEQIK